MFGHKTFERVLQDLLDRVPDNVDKLEGSIIYDALAPTAMEIAEIYSNIDIQRKRTFAETADGYDLEMRASEIGVLKNKASAAIRKGIFTDTNSKPLNVPLGSEFRLGDIVYSTHQLIEPGVYQMKADVVGEVGNYDFGTLLPLEPINNLGSAILAEVLIPGIEEESDERLKERYRRNIIDPSQDGNEAQYKEWAETFEGIGTAKVFPLWNGGNTVKVSITNGLHQVASTELIEKFQEYLDPGGLGLGNGVAPVGAKVKVTGGVRKDVNISGNITLATGFSEPEGVAESIIDYLASITYLKNSVSYMRIAVAILDTPSIADLSNLTINGQTVDIILTGEEIPTLNSLNLVVVNE